MTKITRLSGYLLLTLGLSPALLLPFKQVVWASENATTPLAAWKEVDLVYARLFPYDRASQPHPPAGCVALPAISHHIDKQGTGTTTRPPVLMMLRCRERIDLLRPAPWVSSRLHQQNQQGYLWLSIPEMGIMNVQVHMVAVRSSSFNPAVLNVKSALSRPVVGLFIRHTTNVKQYTFKDTITGKLDRIKSTPNHPFYVANQHRYIPVSHLSTHDRLVNGMGHPVTLVCPTGKTSHCGQPYHPGQVITVYNLEVYGQHRYFVGEPGIMVHNVYYCKYCNTRFNYYDFLIRHHRLVHPDETRMPPPLRTSRLNQSQIPEKPFICKVCNETFSNDKLAVMHYQSEHHEQNIDDDYVMKFRRLKLEEKPRARSRSPIESLGERLQSLRADIPEIPPLASADDKRPSLSPSLSPSSSLSPSFSPSPSPSPSPLSLPEGD